MRRLLFCLMIYVLIVSRLYGLPVMIEPSIGAFVPAIGSLVTEPTCDAQFVEQSGLIVAEVESATVQAQGWELSTDFSGYTGQGYYMWLGSDQFSVPGTGFLEYKIQINTPGTYRFQWHCKVGEGADPKESNDSWLRIPDAHDFYGKKLSTGDVVHPRGVCTNDCPDGAGADGWFKVYSSGTTAWTWSTNANDGDNYAIFARFDNSGVYTVQISGRSRHHCIDRFVLYNESVSTSDATKLTNTQTYCSFFDPLYQNVQFKVTDGTNNVNYATITFQGATKSTNTAGLSPLWLNVHSGSNLPYTVKAAGFYDFEGTLDASGEDIIEDVILTPLPRHSITSIVEDESGPVKDAKVRINSYTILSDASGTTFHTGLIQGAGIPYKVSKEGYQTLSGTILLVKDSTVKFTLVRLMNGIDDAEGGVQLYPNPVGEVLTVASDVDIESVVLRDTSGKEVMNLLTTGTEFEIDLATFAPGCYTLQLNLSNKSTLYRKVIKQ